jgi:hypothetical protein
VLWWVLASALLAAATLTLALWLTRPSDQSAAFASERLSGTPERAAESFIDAYQSGAWDRAAHFATGELADKLQQRPPAERAASADHEAFVVQESHRMQGQRLRLVGVVVREGEAESAGKNVSLVLQKHAGRYLVEEIAW